MNSKQAEKLRYFREAFITERASIGRVLEGRDPRVFSEELLMDLTLEDLRFLASFPERIRPFLIDESLSPSQILDDHSPVYDLAKSTLNENGQALGSIVGKTIEALTDLRLSKMKAIKAFLDQDGVERFGEVNFNQIFNDKGFDLKTCTLRFLNEIDPKKIAKEIREEIFGMFGFKVLFDGCASEEKPIRIRNLKDVNEVLYSELLEELVNGYAEETLKKRGHIQDGNTEIAYSTKSELKLLGIESNRLIMYVFDLGINPKSFKLEKNPKRAFHNTPDFKHSPHQKGEPTLVISGWKKTIHDKTKKASFTVVDDLYFQKASFVGGFGNVSQRG